MCLIVFIVLNVMLIYLYIIYKIIDKKFYYCIFVFKYSIMHEQACVCICIHMHAYASTCVYVHVYICICVYMCLFA